MKKTFALLSLLLSFTVSAQWSNTTNRFADSLHMPVSLVPAVQKNPILLRSYPDSGYFVIWEDDRNFSTTKTDIYAQKYDKNGIRLWAENGVPVVNGPNSQYYVFSSNQDYRNRAIAATDSANGFYIAYIDDSVNQYSWNRMCIQHMQSNGVPVFGGAGFIAASPIANDSYSQHASPFLIADGNKGCYLSYYKPNTGQLFVYCYRDEGGTMKNYGGGQVNFNAIQRSAIGPCGIRTYLEYPGTTVFDYNIWPDGQGGCNVIISMSGNAAGQGPMLTYNRVWRARKESVVRSFFRNQKGLACPRYTTYKKDNVYVLYQFGKNSFETICGGGGGPLYVVTSERLTGNGYLLLDHGGYDYGFPKGVTVSTAGNINADLMAAVRRSYVNNTVSDFIVYGYGYASERYDSVPYQAAANNNPDLNYNSVAPEGMDALSVFRDTLLAAGNYYLDFSLAGGGGHVYAASLMSTSGPRNVRLQHLAVEQPSPGNFAFVRKTANKHGEVIGKEVNAGFSGYNISYDHPLLGVNNQGQALFYIREYGRTARVSPVLTGARLEWGAMGRPLGEGVHQNMYYSFEHPHALLDPFSGTGLIAWRDTRYFPGMGDNIFMRHLDNLTTPGYAPAYKIVRLLPNPYGGTVSLPIVLTGTSTKWTTIETLSGLTNGYTTPVAAILDNVNLGSVLVNTVQNANAVRRYNGQPYLDRNYTVVAENSSPGSPIGLRLFFTEAEFNALKSADNGISTPADLVVIKQPNSNLNNAPAFYSPVAGEEVISPAGWSAVPGGYYLELHVSGFSNFFIQRPPAVVPCAGSNVTLTASGGSSYQWQVNTGSGFVNISDGGVYSGTSTASLQLTGAPTAWYGYQYRCLVDGAPGAPYFLKFSATWTGAANNAWENAANWNCGQVPDANTDVLISTGTPVISSNAAVRTLTLGSGRTVTVKSGYHLTVTR